MTAVSLFDILANYPDKADGDSASACHLAQFAERLIVASLANLQQLREYEKELGSTKPIDPELELKLSRSIWQLYKEWAADAEQVLDRARSLKGSPIQGADRLDDAIGRILARLTVTPEQIANAKQQVREGQFVPAKELRDELHARLRA